MQHHDAGEVSQEGRGVFDTAAVLHVSTALHRTISLRKNRSGIDSLPSVMRGHGLACMEVCGVHEPREPALCAAPDTVPDTAPLTLPPVKLLSKQTNTMQVFPENKTTWVGLLILLLVKNAEACCQVCPEEFYQELTLLEISPTDRLHTLNAFHQEFGVKRIPLEHTEIAHAYLKVRYGDRKNDAAQAFIESKSLSSRNRRHGQKNPAALAASAALGAAAGSMGVGLDFLKRTECCPLCTSNYLPKTDFTNRRDPRGSSIMRTSSFIQLESRVDERAAPTKSGVVDDCCDVCVSQNLPPRDFMDVNSFLENHAEDARKLGRRRNGERGRKGGKGGAGASPASTVGGGSAKSGKSGKAGEAEKVVMPSGAPAVAPSILSLKVLGRTPSSYGGTVGAVCACRLCAERMSGEEGAFEAESRLKLPLHKPRHASNKREYFTNDLPPAKRL